MTVRIINYLLKKARKSVQEANQDAASRRKVLIPKLETEDLTYSREEARNQFREQFVDGVS